MNKVRDRSCYFSVYFKLNVKLLMNKNLTVNWLVCLNQLWLYNSACTISIENMTMAEAWKNTPEIEKVLTLSK